MSHAKTGDKVKVHYEAKLSDGKVLDSSFKHDPLEFTVSGGQVIAGLEQAILGMQPGERKTTVVTPDNAFGPHLDEKVVRLNRNVLPPNLELAKGKQFQGHNADGTSYVVIVTDVSESSVTVDANHPLAGQDLTLDIRLVEIA